jgi:hypothetical protein
MKKVIVIIFNLILLSSCQVFKTSTSKSVDIKSSGVTQKPTIVDLKVDEKKITASITSSTASTQDVFQQQVISEALKKCNCDIIVEPKFESIRKGNQTTTTVTGYPGYYINFRPMTLEDTTFLKIANSTLDKTKAKETTLGKKRKIGPVIIASLGGVVLWVLLVSSLY